MKKSLPLLFVAVLLASPLGYAEKDKGSKADRKAQKELMREQLGITDEQRAQMRKIRKSGGTREEVQAVLTEEQRAASRDLRGKGQRKNGSHAEKTNIGQNNLEKPVSPHAVSEAPAAAPASAPTAEAAPAAAAPAPAASPD